MSVVGIGNNTVPGQSPSIHIILMHNPLSSLSTNTFQGGWVSAVSLDLSDTTSDTYAIPAHLAWFDRVESMYIMCAACVLFRLPNAITHQVCTSNVRAVFVGFTRSQNGTFVARVIL